MTTYPTSTAPAAKQWLFGQMGSTLAAASDATFELTYATRVDTENTPDDMVWFGAVADRVVERLAFVGSMGQDALQEAYDLTVEISCLRAGVTDGTALDPAYRAEARAWALAGQIETIARTDPTLGGNVITAKPNMSQAVVDWDDNGNGRVCSLTLTIHCFATL
jgi:hypothetical protein